MRNWQKTVWSVVSVIVLLTMLVAAASRAATVTSANDYPSTLETSAEADHTLVFTTPSGVADGETIAIAFDTGFDASSITENDVDVEDDGVDLTTAADCSGFEQASVEMASDTLTITICAGDAGAIAAGSEVTVRVGTGATASGTGANQIANPSGTGTYFIGISGTFGDFGTIALPMLDAGSVAVTAQVGGGDGGGGGGGSVGGDNGCGDSIEPDITSVVVSELSAESAVVSWRTSEAADSAVDYGTTDAYEIGTESDSSLSTTHSITLASLSEGAEYHIRIRSSDLCHNEAASSDETFTTVDETAPVISDIGVSLSCDTDAVITWVTNEAANGGVEYGTTTAYGLTSSDTSSSTEHSATIADLSRDTAYHYVVSATDASGNATVSDDKTFVTNQDSAPLNVSGFDAAESDGELTLAWTNPVSDFSGVRVLRCANAYPSDESDSNCSVVYSGTGTSVVLSGLTNGTTYYFGAFSYDGCGQFASGALAEGTPSAPEEEVPVPDEEVPPAETPTEVGDTAETDTETELPSTESETTGTPPSEEVPAGATPSEEAPEIPQTSVSGDELVPERDVAFFVANRQIQLTVASSGAVRLLPSRPLYVSLDREHIPKEVSRVQLVLGDSAYAMAATQDGFSYEADVSSPGTSGSSATAVTIYYADGTIQSIVRTATVQDEGYVFAEANDSTTRIGGATVTLLVNGTVPWDGSPFGQFNPSTTGTDGQFGWYVPNTTYALSAAAGGYTSAETGTFSVTDNIVNRTIRLESTGVETVASPSSNSTSEQVLGAITTVTESVGQALETIRAIPGVEATAAASIPALAVTTTATAVILVTSFDLLPFLQYFFTAPFLFFWRRRRRAYGVVYNAITKVPLDLVTVRLYRMPADWDGTTQASGRLVMSRVTDKGGRYYFLTSPGRYRIVVSKNGFTFPSEYLVAAKTDGQFLDLYHGELIDVSGTQAIIAANIPLDPSGQGNFHEPAKIIRQRRLRVAQQVVAVLGMIFALISVIIRPTMLAFVMLGVQIAFYALVRRLATPKKSKSWGIVYDEATGRPLAHVVARVFEPKYNKLLETAVTDSRGRYLFLLGPNEYYTVYEKPGFERCEVRPIDYRMKREPSEFSADIRMKPKGNASASSQGSSGRTPPPSGSPL